MLCGLKCAVKQRKHCKWNTVQCLSALDCCPTGENREVVKDMQKAKESYSCLQRSSEVLAPSSPSAAVLESTLVVRENLDRKPSFEGDLFCFTAEAFQLELLAIAEPTQEKALAFQPSQVSLEMAFFWNRA